MKLPSIPDLSGLDQVIRRILEPIKQIIEAREGTLGRDTGQRFVTIEELSAIPTWNDASLVNSWANTGTYANAGFSKGRDGLVRLRGVISTGAVPSVALVLPIGYRPAFKMLFAVASNGALGEVEVLTTGDVNVIAPSSNVQVSLDNIIFSAA